MKIEVIDDGVQIASDGRTVWVNGTDGCCVGRFSRGLMEVHRTATGQIETGEECLDCRHEASWADFVAAIKAHYGIVVSDEHRPKTHEAAA